MDYRFKHNVKVFRFPSGYEEEDRGLKGCCQCKQLALAHLTDTAIAVNDFKGVVERKSEPSDSIVFTMENSSGVVIPNLGTVGIFPNDSLAVGFIYDWRQILLTHGPGCYTIRAVFTIAGFAGGYIAGIFNLKSFSVASAKGTVRVRSRFNTYYQKLTTDYTNSNFTDTVRFNGFFGNTQPKTQIKNIIGKNRRVEKATRENLNQYKLNTDPLDICITRQLTGFHFLNEDECFISDHNYHNHDYLLSDTPVILTESSEMDYIYKSRLAKLEATFGDRELLDKNYYRAN